MKEKSFLLPIVASLGKEEEKGERDGQPFARDRTARGLGFGKKSVHSEH